MNFKFLKDFLSTRMRMSHVYQPVMIKRLLSSGGTASIRDIAMDILKLDESQVEYYEAIIKNMVGCVLVSREVVACSGQAFMCGNWIAGDIEQAAD